MACQAPVATKMINVARAEDEDRRTMSKCKQPAEYAGIGLGYIIFVYAHWRRGINMMAIATQVVGNTIYR